MVNWDASDVKEFKKEACDSQQKYCDLLGDREWDVIEHCEWTILRRKVGFGLYGPPESEPCYYNHDTGYTVEQLDAIEKICDQLVGYNQSKNLNFRDYNIHFACIFLVMKVHEKRYTVPVFKAKRENDSSSNCVFVDMGARKYSNWDDYLSNNTLEKCIYCYPALGMYETINHNVNVEFGTSPACNFVSKAFSYFDTSATVATLAATVVGSVVRVATLCNVPIPIMAATKFAGTTTGAYGVTRSSYAFYDRFNHNQKVALTDSQDKVGHIAFLVVQGGSLTVNGMGIAHGLAFLIEKSERNELTPLDVFQFSASVLFFTNSVVSLKTASTIMKEVQHDIIASQRQGLSEKAQKVFNRQTKNLRGPDDIPSNAKVVKQLNRIENSKDLYEVMSNKNVSTN